MIIGISGALSIFYCTIGLYLLDKVGRIKPLMASAIGMASALLVSAVQAQYLNPNNTNQLRSMVAMNFIFSLFYTPLGIISWVYPAEIFPVEVRALGNAITTFTVVLGYAVGQVNVVRVLSLFSLCEDTVTYIFIFRTPTAATTLLGGTRMRSFRSRR